MGKINLSDCEVASWEITDGECMGAVKEQVIKAENGELEIGGVPCFAQVVRLQPNDIIALYISINSVPSPMEVGIMCSELKNVFPKNKVLIIGEGSKIEIIHPTEITNGNMSKTTNPEV